MRFVISLLSCVILIFVVFGTICSMRKKKKGTNTMDATSFSLTPVHEALVQEHDWLNTSRPLESHDLVGRIILLDFWTFCCINCFHVIPTLHTLEQELGGALTVIGVHSAKFDNEKDRENIRSAILRYDITHPVVNDKNFKIWKTFGVSSWPTLVLINPEGKIVQAYAGEGNLELLRHDIARLIEQYPACIKTALPLSLEKEKTAPSILSFPGKLLYVEEFVPDHGERGALFITDSGHHRILGLRLSGEIFLEIGSGTMGWQDGDFHQAQFNKPQGMVYRDNVLYVADTGNHLLRKIDLKNKIVSTIAGTGKRGSHRIAKDADAKTTALASPWDLAWYPSSEHEIAIAMAGTHQLWTYDIIRQKLNILAGNGRESIDDGAYPYNSLSQPSGLSVFDGKLYFVDSETSSLRVLEHGEVTTLIGTGLFDFGYAQGSRGHGLLQHPLGLYADVSGIYIADSYNHSIRRYDLVSNELKDLSGNGQRGDTLGTLEQARYNEPNAIIKVGSVFYIADTNNNRILILDPEKKNVTLFPVRSVSSAQRKLVDDLPQLKKLPAQTVAAEQSINLQFVLPDGFKINGLAPSWCALFDVTNEAPQLVQEFNKQQMLAALSLPLPALSAGHRYRLQGTVYYCKKHEGAACLLESFDQEIEADERAENKSLTIKIGF